MENRPLVWPYVVGVAGFEPTVPSFRTAFEPRREMRKRENVQVTPLVFVGLNGPSREGISRSSPRFLPGLWL
jgi:hypothetical protein